MTVFYMLVTAGIDVLFCRLVSEENRIGKLYHNDFWKRLLKKIQLKAAPSLLRVIGFFIYFHHLDNLWLERFSNDCGKANSKVVSGGGQGGQNLPPPVPYFPASRTFISRLPLVSVLLPSPVNWQSQNTS